MIGLGVVMFWFLDGLVRGNTAPEAAPWRAGLMAAVVIASLAGLWRSRLQLAPAWAAMIGILGALAVAEVYQRPTGGGLGTWVIYAIVMFAVGHVERDWTRDMAIAGMGIGALVLLAAPAGPPPGGIFNRNMVAATLVALAPAVWARWRWWAIVPLAAAVITGSRGAVVAGLVGVIVLARPWEMIGRWTWTAAPAGAAMLAALVAIRPVTVMRRVECLNEVTRRWWATSPWFGLGPTFQIALQSWNGAPADEAHSVIPTLAAQAGIVGLLIMALAVCLAIVHRHRCRCSSIAIPGVVVHRWQWATLATIGVLSIFENVAAWWPVGIVAVVAMGSFPTNYGDGRRQLSPTMTITPAESPIVRY